MVWNIFGCMQVEAEEASGREESSSIHDISDRVAPERDSQPTLVLTMTQFLLLDPCDIYVFL